MLVIFDETEPKEGLTIMVFIRTINYTRILNRISIFMTINLKIETQILHQK